MTMRLVFLFLLLQALLLSAFRVSAGCGRMVGCRTDVGDVETNKEVQELGLFSVHEYNRRVVLGNHGDVVRRPLVFSRVVAAQRQVVSGIKYFLRMEAGEEGRRRVRTFDAVVVVKPWLSSRTLLSFSPGDDTAERRNRV